MGPLELCDHSNTSFDLKTIYKNITGEIKDKVRSCVEMAIHAWYSCGRYSLLHEYERIHQLTQHETIYMTRTDCPIAELYCQLHYDNLNGMFSRPL